MNDNWLDPRAVGDLISEARHKAGLTQETLSGLAGIGRTVSRLYLDLKL